MVTKKKQPTVQEDVAAQQAETRQHQQDRAWLAAIAMQGLLAAGDAEKHERATVAQDAVMFADALLAELAK